MPQKYYYVYFLTNSHKNVLYTGVTNNIGKRIHEHKNGALDGFTKKYNVDQLIYFEIFAEIEYAINREKQIKRWSRKKKDQLINKANPTWKDLSSELLIHIPL